HAELTEEADHLVQVLDDEADVVHALDAHLRHFRVIGVRTPGFTCLCWSPRGTSVSCVPNPRGHPRGKGCAVCLAAMLMCPECGGSSAGCGAAGNRRRRARPVPRNGRSGRGTAQARTP